MKLQNTFFTSPFSGNRQIFYITQLEALIKQKNLPTAFKNLTLENLNSLTKNNCVISFVHFLIQALSADTVEKNNFILLQANLKDLNGFPSFLQKFFRQKVSCHYYKPISKKEEISGWARKKLHQKNIQLTGEQLHLLLYFCGEDIYTIAQEIEKLSLLKRKIETEDLTKLVSDSKSYKIFTLLQDIIAKNQIKALDGLNYFLIKSPDKNNPQKIFSLLVGELQKLLKVRWLLNEGYKIEKIANFLKLPSWLATKLVKSAANLQPQEIENSLLFLHSNDIAFKYAAKNVEPLIMQFCIQWMKGYFLKRYK